MNDHNIALTIREQLGGCRFAGMTGAKEFTTIKNGVRFYIPRTRNIRRVEVILTGDDLYSMAFYSVMVRNLDPKIKLLKAVYGVSADKLEETFTSITGLNTRL